MCSSLSHESLRWGPLLHSWVAAGPLHRRPTDNEVQALDVDEDEDVEQCLSVVSGRPVHFAALVRSVAS